ncbi:Vesicle-associated membrane protein-associated protein A [Eumeta japonica]|uniref:Vesicle-associated membrane protein-associated protein A n=1 Tax=Eumeta variegata TaxID=151549 RepID=A0A4C1WVU7_EUMVA|nr:Vesicle-associated membrane protein-associated protein A [Eumeta japonica]
MPNQVLLVEPRNELEFKVDHAGLFLKDASSYMWLTNPTTDSVMFKIKTTAPKKYCVRPNSGTLAPNSKIEIAITPQTSYVNPAERTKHKFMVQSIIAPSDLANIDQIWKEVSSDQLMDYKLRCSFSTEASLHSSVNNTNDTLKRDSDSINHLNSKNVIGQIQNKPIEKLKDDFKTSTPIKSASSKIDNQITDIATTEINQLREEGKKLSYENLRLKEEILRLRQAAGDSRNQYEPEATSQVNDVAMVPWLVTAVCMALIGVIVGKFVI